MSTFLAIATNEGTMEKINQLKFLFNTPDNTIRLKVTDANQFLEGKTVASFDYCMICSFAETTADEIEMNADFYDHYLNAPVSAVFATAGAIEIPDMLKDKVIKTWTWDHIEPQDAVTELKNACAELAAMCEEKKASVVKPAFDKYDKDASGNIDRDELASLSADLGQPLSDDQLDAALADLDLNKDGVIDFSEFCRWYFSGMKSYSGQKRTLLKFKNGAGVLGKALQNPELVAAINADKSTVTQTFSASFNEPADPQTQMKVRYNLVGPETTKWTQKGLAFRASQGASMPSSDRQRVIYGKLSVSNRTPEEFNTIKDYLTAALEGPMGEMAKAEAGICFDLQHTGDKICAEFSILPPEHAFPPIPEMITEALTEVDNHVQVELALATCPGEIVKGEKPISECLLGGFKTSASVTYMRNIKKMAAVLPPREAQKLTMISPIFKLGVKANVALKFEDAEDLKEHPMIGDKFDLKFDDIFQMIGVDKTMFSGYETDLSGIDEEKINANEQTKMMLVGLKGMNLLAKVLRGLEEENGDYNVEGNWVIGGLMHAEVKGKTNGVGEMYQLAFNAGTMQMREQLKGMLSSM